MSINQQSTRLQRSSWSENRSDTGAADAVQAARAFINRRFPDCLAALLFGSSARNEPTASSDLDILVIESRRVAPYHLHFEEFGWRFDVMGRSLRFCTKRLLGKNQRRHHLDPDRILVAACAEGIELKDDRGLFPGLRERARLILEQGPLPLSAREITNYRLLITEALDDFVDAANGTEAWFLSYHAVIVTSQFLKGYARRWSEENCKWVYRELRNDTDPLARQLLTGLDRYRRTGDRIQLSRPLESILDLAGGRLYRDDLSTITTRPPTRAQQFLRHPISLTRKALRRILGDYRE